MKVLRLLPGSGSFAALHAGNMILGIGYSIALMLVLSHILSSDQYAEIVFLTIVGIYFQPLDQAIGRTAFIAIRHEIERSGRPRASHDFRTALMVQGILTFGSIALVPAFLCKIGSPQWVTYSLYFALCRATSLWSFGLQSTAWACGLNAAFVRLSTATRIIQAAVLFESFLAKSFLIFALGALSVSVTATAIVVRMFLRQGLFEKGPAITTYRRQATTFVTSFITTGTDFLIINAPYALISSQHGIGAWLVVFDSSMKFARISMAGARTLAEIALPYYAAAVSEHRPVDATRIYLVVITACVGATCVPAVMILRFGHEIFHLLLGPNDIVPPDALAPAAMLMLASGLYQPATFFVGHCDQSRPAKILALSAVLGFVGCAIVSSLVAMSPAGTLQLFATYIAVLALLAFTLAVRLHPHVIHPAAVGETAN